MPSSDLVDVLATSRLSLSDPPSPPLDSPNFGALREAESIRTSAPDVQRALDALGQTTLLPPDLPPHVHKLEAFGEIQATESVLVRVSQASDPNPIAGNLDIHLALSSAMNDQAADADVSPINRIPPEVLGYIFTLTLQVITMTSTAVPFLGSRVYNKPWVLGSPWALGQVCGTWRTLAVSSPTLWTSIVVSTAMWPRELPLVQIQLERSGAAPLDLLIRFTSGQRFENSPIDFFMPKITRECGRWRSVHFDFDNSPGRSLDSLGALPLLRQVVFTGRSRHYFKNYDFFKVFAKAPRLCAITLSNPGQLSLRDIPLPWSQITTYKATYTDGLTHCKNLSVAANLVECDIDFDPGVAEQDRICHSGIVTLPCLRRLVITRNQFLDCLVAPSLQELHVHGKIERVLLFLHTSAFVLTRLTLFKCDAADTQVIHLLQNTPSLCALALDFLGPSIATNSLISALTLPVEALEGEILCPKLVSLSWGDRNDTMDRVAFVDMVESRWRVSRVNGRQLRFVGVYLGRRRLKASGMRMREFVEQGMDVLVLNARKGRPAMDRWREY
ncbi:hypothetical protein DFH07DRAFT_794796 [Mycena maculata]|uniref:F-box domain-containing protein n=1 Tax=Mycena maculata TaxID=230809 RepID=A0AAD7K8H0_9AGAR|nr:hypothetical protein DFH07DRAFT_794796 [Mycena maculata]